MELYRYSMPYFLYCQGSSPRASEFSLRGEKGGKRGKSGKNEESSTFNVQACLLQAGFKVQGSMLGVSKRRGDGGYGGLPLLSSSNSFIDSLT